MGFKDLSLFNEALLGKQVWRLLHNKNSLFYRVFKSRFFPDCTILEAKGHGGSYAWKRILKGRGVILRGARWRVGDGESIKIYGDNWLPTATNSGIHGPLPLEFQNASVSSLINHQTHTWDLDALSTALSPFEADLVQKITLSRGQSMDVLFWPFVQSGIYSVKSGYYFLKSEIRTATQAQAITDQPKPPWNRIWKLSLPNKIKNFLWRAVHNALPTNSELTRRCIINDPICSFCSSQGEDVLHALWSCPSLSQVWDGDP
ncbi:hypothetical protein SO802_022069 [Lithocarpus litseifolius]|uniref:Reverse transcriptase zinc-binding domain-containing protein n=1 Tax=Lithocarpus litseifolius TaxID=425828 RepID=A0AAW2CIQ7_9ROSI